jgi:predicted PurR-regulated permease PerM
MTPENPAGDDELVEALAVSDMISQDEPDDKSPETLIEEIHDAAETEARADDDHPFGRTGPRFDRRAPFFVGMNGALGVAVIAGLVLILMSIGQILLLIGMAIIIAVGLDPAVSWLIGRGLPRWVSVSIVLAVALGIFVGFLALAIPVLVKQTTHLANDIPNYLHVLRNPHTFLGHLNSRFHFVSKVQKFLSKSGTSAIAGGVLGVGKVVADLLEAVLVVGILAIYLLADLPRVKRGLYRFAPNSRRARVVLLTDEIMVRIGGYVLGNLLTSVIAGIGTWGWATAFNIPYAFLLGFMVALLDLIPIIGSTVGGIIVSLIGLTVSFPIAVATAVFYVVYRFLEDYLLTPRIMARTVQVPGLLTVIATLIGGTLLGIIGALIAIPVAAALKLLVEETMFANLEDM